MWKSDDGDELEMSYWDYVIQVTQQENKIVAIDLMIDKRPYFPLFVVRIKDTIYSMVLHNPIEEILIQRVLQNKKYNGYLIYEKVNKRQRKMLLDVFAPQIMEDLL